MYSKLSLSLGLLATATLALAEPTVYLIRHGEKPSNGSTGLNAVGFERADCLKTVFGPDSNYDIGYIIAEQPKSGTSILRLIVGCGIAISS